LGSEQDGGTPREERLAGVLDAELIKNIIGISRQAFCHNVELSGQIVQTLDQKFRAAHADEIARARPRTGGGQQGTMHGHGLSGIFDAAGGPQTPFCAQRVMWIAMTVGATVDARRIPGDDGSEQAHAALVRYALSNGGVV
jgi:hypothetical protein